MKNMVVLQKNKDGKIYCQELSSIGRKYVKAPAGQKYVKDNMKDNRFWDDGGTIVLEELEEILDKEI